jgi:hypothetical protein
VPVRRLRSRLAIVLLQAVLDSGESVEAVAAAKEARGAIAGLLDASSERMRRFREAAAHRGRSQRGIDTAVLIRPEDEDAKVLEKLTSARRTLRRLVTLPFDAEAHALTPPWLFKQVQRILVPSVTRRSTDKPYVTVPRIVRAHACVRLVLIATYALHFPLQAPSSSSSRSSSTAASSASSPPHATSSHLSSSRRWIDPPAAPTKRDPRFYTRMDNAIKPWLQAISIDHSPASLALRAVAVTLQEELGLFLDPSGVGVRHG